MSYQSPGDLIEKTFKDLIWKSLKNLYPEISHWAEDKIGKKLKDLELNKTLSSSPLVKVIPNPSELNQDNYKTFLIVGRIPLYKGAESVFMRVEATISTDIDLHAGGPPLKFVDWATVLGDLKIKKDNLFSANIGFGFDKGAWKGRGALKIEPAGIDLDIALGGLSDDGLVVDLAADLPAPIPIGGTGLGLVGLGGSFAYNFVPRLESSGQPVTDPTGEDYVRWAKNIEPIDRWIPAPIEKAAMGIGIRTDLVTLADNGYVLRFEGIGLVFLIPGPVFIFGGKGKLLSTSSAEIDGYTVVDIASKSMALGYGAEIRIPASKPYLVEAHGTLDAFFSLDDPSAWYINLGNENQKIAATIITDLYRAGLFFAINNNRIALGAEISIGNSWSIWKLKLTAQMGVSFVGKIAWNPFELEAVFAIWGELSIKIYKFKFGLRLDARALGHIPQPYKLEFDIKITLDLPWPIPDVSMSTKLYLGDKTPQAPTVASPLLAGQIGFLHALTGRQWTPESQGIWPDIDIVVPFTCLVENETGLGIPGSATGPYVEGGYKVDHKMTKLEIRDITDDPKGVTISGIGAVWRGVKDGSTAASLHVNGTDPFSWFAVHETETEFVESTGRTVEQDFGAGDYERFRSRRFNELIVAMPTERTLSMMSLPPLSTRVILAQSGCKLYLRTRNGVPIKADIMTLYIVATPLQMSAYARKGYTVEQIAQLYGVSVSLWAVTISMSPPGDEFVFDQSLFRPYIYTSLYAVRYHDAGTAICKKERKVLFETGKWYKLILEGNSQAMAADEKSGLPSSERVDWSLNQEFAISSPDNLRPYIRSSTLGDSRIFSDEDLPWNPTMYGYGFPAYRRYLPVVRFKVPYMARIFPQIRFQIISDSGEITEETLLPTENGTAESNLPKISQRWIESNYCGNGIEADEELVLNRPLPKAGSARVRLSSSEDGLKLDEWTCHISRFDSFRDHLNWPRPCVTVIYWPMGRMIRKYCRPISMVDPSDRPWVLVPEKEMPVLPDDWCLPPDLANLADGPLDETTGIRFARFALESNARFHSGSGDVLDGINKAATKTAIEAIADYKGRPYALWFRTPEPVDWRRVTASLKILLVTRIQSAGSEPETCPNRYNHRRAPIELTLNILPSPDATSAFLIGVRGPVDASGIRQIIRLPKGEYELKLTFDHQKAELPPLHPDEEMAAPETITLKFIQPSGEDLPSQRR